MAQLVAQEQEKLQLVCNDFATQINAELGLPIPIEMDWSFINDQKFASASDNNKKDTLQKLGNTFLKTGITHQEFGFIPHLKKSARACQIVKNTVTKIVIQPTYETSLPSPNIGNSYYYLKVDLPTITYRVRLDSLNYTDGFGYKLDYGMNLGILFELWTNEANVKAKAHEIELANKFGKLIPIVVDWNTVATHQTFDKSGDSTKKSYIINIVETFVKTGLFGSNGLVDFANKSERAKALMQQNIQQITIKVHPGSDLKHKVDNSYYCCDYENGNLVFTVRLDSLNYTNGFGYKTDVEMNLEITLETMIRKGYDELKPIVAKFAQDYGREIPVEIAWDFVKDDKFIAQSDSSKSSTIQNMVKNFINTGLNSSGESFSVWANRSQRYKYTIDQKVSKIVATCTFGSITPGDGNSYYQCKYDSSVLYLTARADSLNYTDGWGLKINNVLEIHQVEEMAMKDAEKKMREIEAKFQPAINRQIPLFIDYDSFLVDPSFIKQSDSNKKSTIVNSTKVLETGLVSSGTCLINHAQSKDLLQYVHLIVLKPTYNKPKPGVGNSYYCLEFIDGALVATVDITSLNYTDGFGQKLEALRPIITSTQVTTLYPIMIHKYLSLDFSYITREVPPTTTVNINPLLCSPSQPLMSFNVANVAPQLLQAPSVQGVMAPIAPLPMVQPVFLPPPVAVVQQPAPVVVQQQQPLPQPIGMPAQQQPAVVVGAPTPIAPAVVAPVVAVVGAAPAPVVAQQPAAPARDYFGFQKEITDSEKQLVEYSGNMTKALGKNITLSTDWSFITALDPKNTNIPNTIKNLSNNMAYYLQSSMSNICKDDVVKTIIAAKISNSVILKLDLLNTLQPPNYKLVIDETGTFHYIVNLAQVASSPSQLGDKLEDFFEAYVPKLLRDGNEQMKQKEQEIAQTVGKTISYKADWNSFILSSEYIQLSRDDKKKHVQGISNNTAYYLAQFFKKLAPDAIAKEAIVTLFDNVVFAIDVKNSLNDPIQPQNYTLVHQKETKTLVVTTNLAQSSNSLSNLDKKFDPILNIRIKQAIREAKAKFPELEERIKAKTGKPISVGANWDAFTTHKNFLAYTFDEYTNIINKIHTNHLYYISTGIETLSQDNIFKEQFPERVQKIEFSYDPENTINETVKPQPLALSLANNTLYVRINLKDWNSSVGNVPEKMDPLMRLRVLQGQRDFEKSREKYEKVIAEGGFTATIHCDWEFTKHAKFLAYPLPTHTEVFARVYNNHMYYLTNAIKNMCTSTNSNAVVGAREALQHFIKKIVFVYDAEDRVKSAISKNNRWKFDRNGVVMYIVMNLSDWSPNIDSIDEKLKLFVINMVGEYNSLKSIASSAQSLQQSCNKSIPLTINWHEFVLYDEFMLHKDQKNVLSHMYSGHLKVVVDSIAQSCQSHQIGRDNILANLDSVQVHMTMQAAEKNLLITYADKVIHVHVPFGNCLANFTVRSTQILIEWAMGYMIPVRIALADIRIANHFTTAAPATGKPIPIAINWAFTQEALFLQKNTPEQMTVYIENCADKAARQLVRDLCELYEHPVNAATMNSGLSNVLIHIAHQCQGGIFHITREQNQVTLVLSFDMLMSKNPVESFQPRFKFLYDIILAVAIYNSKPVFEQLQKGMFDACQKNIPIETNITFASFPEFRSFEPRVQVLIAEAACSKFAQHVHSQLVKLCAHPVSKQFIQANIDKLEYAIDAKNSITIPSGAVAYNNRTLSMTLNMKDLESHVAKADTATNWKHKIEYLFDLIVPVACHDAESTRAVLESNLRNAINAPIAVVLDFAFSKSTQFKDLLTPAVQATTAYDTCARYPAQIIAAMQEIALVPTGKATLAQFARLILTFDEKNSQVQGGQFITRGADLCVISNLNEFDAILKKEVLYWKNKILQHLNIIVQVSSEEVANFFVQHQEFVNKCFNTAMPITINWNSFALSNEFRGLDVPTQASRVKFLCTEYLQHTMAGFEKFAPYNVVLQTILSKFKSIQVDVLPSFSQEGVSHTVNIVNNVLVITTTWNSFMDKSHANVYFSLEKFMNLRPMLEDEAIKAVSAVMKSYSDKIAETLSAASNRKPSPVCVDWDLLRSNPVFIQTPHYLPIIERIPHSVGTALFSNEKYPITSLDAGVLKALNECNDILFIINMGNNTNGRTQFPDSRFINREYDIRIASGHLCVEINSSGLNTRKGFGLNACWTLAPSEAKYLEAQMYKEILNCPEPHHFKDIIEVKDYSTALYNMAKNNKYKLGEVLNSMDDEHIIYALKDMGSESAQMNFLEAVSDYDLYRWIRNLSNSRKSDLIKVLQKKARGYVVFGKIEYVKYHGNVKVEERDYHGDIRIQIKSYHADKPGQWEIVKYHGDWQVEMVKYHGDFTAEIKH